MGCTSTRTVLVKIVFQFNFKTESHGYGFFPLPFVESTLNDLPFYLNTAKPRLQYNGVNAFPPSKTAKGEHLSQRSE